MVRIFNNKERKEILIDESADWIQFMPRPYDEDDPHVLIEMNGFDWARHADECSDCGSLLATLGKSDHFWRLSWNNQIWPLNLVGVGPQPGKNRLVYKIGSFFDGTRMKLKLDIRTQDELRTELEECVNAEEYERCVIVRDIINARADIAGS